MWLWYGLIVRETIDLFYDIVLHDLLNFIIIVVFDVDEILLIFVSLLLLLFYYIILLFYYIIYSFITPLFNPT